MVSHFPSIPFNPLCLLLLPSEVFKVALEVMKLVLGYQLKDALAA
jgi:hypothetical protein